MEPLSSFSLASVILEFLEFGLKTASLVRQIKTSHDGATIANRDLLNRSEWLKDLSAKLTINTESNTDLYHSKSDRAIHALSTKCQEHVQALQELLRSLQADKGGKGLSSTFSALKTVWNDRRVRELEDALQKASSELHIHLTASLYSKNSGQSKQAAADPSETSSLSNGHSSSISETDQGMFDLTRRFERSCIMAQPNAYNDCEVMRRALLDHLYYTGMYRRYHDLSRVCQGSFEWIFNYVHDSQCLYFTRWLETKSGIYWITGKPGSGKSMLMKYICEHRHTSTLLERWHQGRPPVVAKFFFWVRLNSIHFPSLPDWFINFSLSLAVTPWRSHNWV